MPNTTSSKARAATASNRRSATRSKANSNRNVAAKDKKTAKEQKSSTVVKKNIKSGTSTKKIKSASKAQSSLVSSKHSKILSDSITIPRKCRSPLLQRSLVTSGRSYADVASSDSNSSSSHSSYSVSSFTTTSERKSVSTSTSAKRKNKALIEAKTSSKKKKTSSTIKNMSKNKKELSSANSKNCSSIEEAPIARKRVPKKNRSIASIDDESSIEVKSKTRSSIEDGRFVSKFESFIFETISSLKSSNEALLNNNKLLSEALANSNRLSSQLVSNTSIEVLSNDSSKVEKNLKKKDFSTFKNIRSNVASPTDSKDLKQHTALSASNIRLNVVSPTDSKHLKQHTTPSANDIRLNVASHTDSKHLKQHTAPSASNIRSNVPSPANTKHLKQHTVSLASNIRSNVPSCIPKKVDQVSKSQISVYEVTNFDRSFQVCKSLNIYVPDKYGEQGPDFSYINHANYHDTSPFYQSIDLTEFEELAKDPKFFFNPKPPPETFRSECLQNKDGTKKRSTRLVYARQKNPRRKDRLKFVIGYHYRDFNGIRYKNWFRSPLKSNLVEVCFHLIKNANVCYGKKQIETYITQYCREFQFYLRKYGFDRAYLLSFIKEEIKVTVKGIYVPQYWEVNSNDGLPTNRYAGRLYSFSPPDPDLLLSDDSSVDTDHDFYARQGRNFIRLNDSAFCSGDNLKWEPPKNIIIPIVHNEHVDIDDCCSIEQGEIIDVNDKKKISSSFNIYTDWCKDIDLENLEIEIASYPDSFKSEEQWIEFLTNNHEHISSYAYSQLRIHPEKKDEQITIPTVDEYKNAINHALCKSLDMMIKKYTPEGDNVSIDSFHKAREILNYQFHCAKTFLESIPSNHVWDLALRRYYLSPIEENDENKFCYCPCSGFMKHWRKTMNLTNPYTLEGLTCRNRLYNPIGLVSHLASQREYCDLHVVLYYYLYYLYDGYKDMELVSIDVNQLIDNQLNLHIINRNDGYRSFILTDHVQNLDSIEFYHDKISIENFCDSLEEVMELCEKKFNNLRKSWNHCIGSTTFAGITPKFLDPETGDTPMLPRPYKLTLENYHILINLWITYFIVDLATVTLQLLKKAKKQAVSSNQQDIVDIIDSIICDAEFCIKYVPKELRVFHTFFTQGTIVGEVNKVKHFMPAHFDKCDKISCLVTFGKDIVGGNTVYHDGCSPKKQGVPVMSVPFSHGRIQIGTYCSLLHSISGWDGVRMTLSLNMKKRVVNHFKKFGQKFFKQYKDEGFPRNVRLYK